MREETDMGNRRKELEVMGDFSTFSHNHFVCLFVFFQRIQLYNAFANSAMCASGINVLDVYPISASYPPGTKDGIHYNNDAFDPVIEFLEKYFSPSCPSIQ